MMEIKDKKPEIENSGNIFFARYCDDLEYPKQIFATGEGYVVIDRGLFTSALSKTRVKYGGNILPFQYDERENYFIGNCLVKFGRALSPNCVDIIRGVDLFSDSRASLESIIKDLGLPLEAD